MPIITQDIREVAALNDGYPLRHVLETATFNETISYVFAHTTRDAAVLNDTVTDKTAGLLRDTAVFSDAVSQSATYRTDTRDSAVLLDTQTETVVVTDDVHEAAVLNDLTTQGPQSCVRDTAALNDTVTQTLTATQTVRDTAVLGDRLAGITETIRDAAVLNDATSEVVRATQTVRDTAALNDTATDDSTPVETVRDSFAAADETSVLIHHDIRIRERMFISGDVEQPVTDTAWTANVQTWAMSRYTGFPYDSFTASYAAGEGGLYAVGDETFIARIETGDCLLGSNQKKRVVNVYGTGNHDLPLTVEVSADVNGERHTGTYQQMARNADDTRVVRTDIGRGFFSNTFRFAFESETDFELFGAEVNLAESTRRI